MRTKPDAQSKKKKKKKLDKISADCRTAIHKTRSSQKVSKLVLCIRMSKVSVRENVTRLLVKANLSTNRIKGLD